MPNPGHDGLRSPAVHWLPAPASGTVVDVVVGGVTTVLVAPFGAVVVVAAGTLGAVVRPVVPEQPARRTTRADTATKPTRSRFTSRSYTCRRQLGWPRPADPAYPHGAAGWHPNRAYGDTLAGRVRTPLTSCKPPRHPFGSHSLAHGAERRPRQTADTLVLHIGRELADRDHHVLAVAGVNSPGNNGGVRSSARQHTDEEGIEALQTDLPWRGPRW